MLENDWLEETEEIDIDFKCHRRKNIKVSTTLYLYIHSEFCAYFSIFLFFFWV